MSQTMLAVLALMLVSLFAYQQQRSIAAMQMEMVRNEVATQATGVATDWLEEIGAAAFDQYTVGEDRISTADSLTPGPPFNSDGEINDIDDFDGAVVVRSRVNGPDTLRFRLETTVRYADELNPSAEVAGRTKYKKATVRVYSLDLSHPDTVYLSQSYACGSRCNW